jgi:hypothetical protein
VDRRLTLVLVISIVGCGESPNATSLPNTPEEVVKAYVAIDATQWERRLPYVLNPEKVRPLMARQYAGVQRKRPAKPGTVLHVKNKNVAVGSTITVTVDASESHPEYPQWTYVVMRTQEGFKVDWEASIALTAKQVEERRRLSRP